MAKSILAGIVGVGLALGLGQGITQAQDWCRTPEVRDTMKKMQAAQGRWKPAGRYASYREACYKAQKLQDRGYETCIEPEGNCWCVYYR
jgi:hypothetical protein